MVVCAYVHIFVYNHAHMRRIHIFRQIHTRTHVKPYRYRLKHVYIEHKRVVCSRKCDMLTDLRERVHRGLTGMRMRTNSRQFISNERVVFSVDELDGAPNKVRHLTRAKYSVPSHQHHVSSVARIT